MNKPHLVADYMEGFFRQYLGALRGVSDKTILAYRDALKLLLCFASDLLGQAVDALAIEELDDKVIVAFLDHLEKERNCCVRTRNARLAAVSTFFKYAGRQEPALLSQCHAIRTISYKRDEHKALDYLDNNEIQAVFESIVPSSRTGVRDKALILFLFNTGARVQECADVTTERLRLDPQGQVTLLGKGRKERVCPLWTETVQAWHTCRIEIRGMHKSCAFSSTPTANPSRVSESGISSENVHERPARNVYQFAGRKWGHTPGGTRPPSTCCNPATTSM